MLPSDQHVSAIAPSVVTDGNGITELCLLSLQCLESGKKSGWALFIYISRIGRTAFPRELEKHFHIRHRALRSMVGQVDCASSLENW